MYRFNYKLLNIITLHTDLYFWTANMGDDADKKQIDCSTYNQNYDEANVKLLFNKVYAVNVNKRKLIKKSLYFRAFLNAFRKNHLSRFFEVNFETSRNVFKRVARYIEKGSLHFSKNDIFQVYELAFYLGIAGLQQLCLDHFAFNLTSGNVENRLKSLRKHQLSGNDFEKVALQFEKSGLPSLSGLYFLATEKRKFRSRHLMMYCTKTNSVHDIKVDIPEKERYELERFSSVLAISYPEKHLENESSLLLYDIVSGKVDQVSTVRDVGVSTNRNDSNQTIICSSSARLFVISVAENYKIASRFSLSIYEKSNGKVELSGNKSFYQPFKGKLPVFGKVYLLFAHYAMDKVFIFYCEDKCKSESYKQIDIKNELYMVTVCVETLSVVKNEKVLIENPELDKVLVYRKN